MVGTSSEKGFGQRDEQNWCPGFNQSIIAMTHRLTRPVNYNQDNPTQAAAHDEYRPIWISRRRTGVVVAISLAIGLGLSQ